MYMVSIILTIILTITLPQIVYINIAFSNFLTMSVTVNHCWV